MKDILEEPNIRLNKVEDWISNLEDKVVKNTQLKQPKEKRTLKNEDNVPWLV